MVFKKEDTKSYLLPKKHVLLEIAYSDKLLQLLQIPRDKISDLIILQKNQIERFLEFLNEEISSSEIKLNLNKELTTLDNRKKQLQETKNIVFSLRETDRTSDEALDFLQEKLTLLQKEQEDLELQILVFQEKLATITTDEVLQTLVDTFISEISFIDTDAWEEELDYFRTRFLLQREQEEKDQKLKEKFLPNNYTNNSEDSLNSIQIVYLKLAVPMKYFAKIKSQVMGFNKLMVLNQKLSTEGLNKKSAEEINEIIKIKETESLEIGRELYALKKEQGILTLKTFEIIQTIKSRLLNITGSIASRRFLKDGLNDLITHSRDATLAYEEKKNYVSKEAARLLRIIRKEPAEGT